MRSSAVKPLAPPEPPPIEMRSLPSVARATSQPLFTSPTTSSSGTKTSSKNTSLKCAWPVMPLQRIDRHAGGFHVDRHHRHAGVLGGVGIGADGRQAPLAEVGQAGPHLLPGDPPARRRPSWPPCAPRRHREPAPGSENSWHHITSPRSTGSTQRSRWSSVPAWEIVSVTQPVMPMSGRSTPLNSSSMTSCSSTSAARPHGFGQCGTR